MLGKDKQQMRLKKAKRKKTKIDDVKEIELKITKDKQKIK